MTDWAEQARLGELLVTIEAKYNRGKAMTEQELEEAVARAICIENGYDPNVMCDYIGGSCEKPQWTFSIRHATAAIAAYRQLVASEAVGEQRRFQLPDGKWTEWYVVVPLLEVLDEYPFETRPLFAAPPAPQPVTEDGHIWHEKVFSSMKIKCCMNCGFIKNEDKPNKPCPGPIGVGLREAAAPPAPQPGWKLVPVEPTEEMIKAGRFHYTDITMAYAAMLEAAPTPEGGE